MFVADIRSSLLCNGRFKKQKKTCAHVHVAGGQSYKYIHA